MCAVSPNEAAHAEAKHTQQTRPTTNLNAVGLQERAVGRWRVRRRCRPIRQAVVIHVRIEILQTNVKRTARLERAHRRLRRRERQHRTGRVQAAAKRSIGRIRIEVITTGVCSRRFRRRRRGIAEKPFDDVVLGVHIVGLLVVVQLKQLLLVLNGCRGLCVRVRCVGDDELMVQCHRRRLEELRIGVRLNDLVVVERRILIVLKKGLLLLLLM